MVRRRNRDGDAKDKRFRGVLLKRSAATGMGGREGDPRVEEACSDLESELRVPRAPALFPCQGSGLLAPGILGALIWRRAYP